jgi:predicted cupin superfamily sugar epimerase
MASTASNQAIPFPDRPETAEEIIRLLELAPHPEGGFYREMWRDRPADGSRGAGTSIYFLLPSGVENRWHRVDAAEIWHFYVGAPLELSIAGHGRAPETRILGTALIDGERPQVEIPANAWQRARSLGPWTLVGCTVSPAFEFSRFEIAPNGWIPPAR